MSEVFSTTWQAPSNIAVVKYWGKKGLQIPANPSLSMTLKKCTTTTQLIYDPHQSTCFEFLLEGKKQDSFATRINTFIQALGEDFSFLKKGKLKITSSNSFPHSTGIASSASSMAALTLCLTDLKKQITAVESSFTQTSSLARLASGSACRSVYGGWVSWGEESLEYATPVNNIHENFKNLQDSVLVVSSGAKKVSSSQGHKRMEQHPYAESRYQEAHKNFTQIKKMMTEGDLWSWGKLVEQEALSLHAMLMLSGITLMHPHSLILMEKIVEWREKENIPVFFTLDAGPNIHLLYPFEYKLPVKYFLDKVASLWVEEIIEDEIGDGPRKIL